MKVYLDNNIVVSIENGDMTIEQLNSLFPDQPEYLYSCAHLFEAEYFPGNDRVSKADFLSRRFSTIRLLFNRYLDLQLSDHVMKSRIEDPAVIYETITDTPFGLEAMKAFANWITEDQKQELRNALGIESRLLNNYSPEDVLVHINRKLESLTNQSFLQLVENGIKMHPDHKKMGLNNTVGAVFELLDMIGYWKDRVTNTSNYARQWDSDHAFHAMYCDYFISDDYRTRQKTKVVYKLYDIDTQVISSKGI